MRQIIINSGIVVLLLCVIAIGFLSGLVGQEIRQLAYLADDQPPSDTRHSISVRKKKSSALVMSYYIRSIGYTVCGLGMVTLLYCSYRDRKQRKNIQKPFTISEENVAEQGAASDR